MFDALFAIIGSIGRFFLEFIFDSFLGSGGSSIMDACHRKNGQLPRQCKVLMTLTVAFIIGVLWLIGYASTSP
jgi:hypothetical protein